mgnify:CR=1 FL=1
MQQCKLSAPDQLLQIEQLQQHCIMQGSDPCLTLSAVSCDAALVWSQASWDDCLAWSTLSEARPDTCRGGRASRQEVCECAGGANVMHDRAHGDWHTA